MCCWVLLKNPLSKCKSGERRQTKSSCMFSLQAAHSFCQWQCVVRDAIMLNYTLLEPVPSPLIHDLVKHSHKLKACMENYRKVTIFDTTHYCYYPLQLSANLIATVATVFVVENKQRMITRLILVITVFNSTFKQ